MSLFILSLSSQPFPPFPLNFYSAQPCRHPKQSHAIFSQQYLESSAVLLLYYLLSCLCMCLCICLCSVLSFVLSLYLSLFRQKTNDKRQKRQKTKDNKDKIIISLYLICIFSICLFSICIFSTYFLPSSGKIRVSEIPKVFCQPSNLHDVTGKISNAGKKQVVHVL